MAISIPIISEFRADGIQKAIKQFSQLETTGQKAQFAIRKAALPATAALGGMFAGLTAAAKGAEDARRASQRLGNVLDSMGFAEATDRVDAYAEELEKVVAVDADVIKATQTKLATFGELTKTVNQAGGAFDRATLAALDMAAAGFGSAEQNAVQLGKALQDPIKGINALRRSGIDFTESEKDKIKTLVESGRILEAQNIILKAVEKQVGGTAKASASSFDKMRFALAGVADTFGEAFLPVIDAVVPRLQSLSTIVQRNGAIVGSAIVVISGFATAIIAANFALKAWRTISVITTAVNAALATSFTAVQIATGVGIATAIAGAAAFVALKDTFKDGISAANGYKAAIDGVDGALGELSYGLNESQLAVMRFVGPVSDATLKLQKEYAQIYENRKRIAENRKKEADAEEAAARAAQAAADRVKQAAKEAAARVKELRTEFGTQFTDALKKGKTALDDATKAFDDFAKNVAGAVTSAFSFKDAYDAGKDTGTGFFKALEDQAAQAKTFGELVNRLVAAGLNETALQQVLSAGASAGTEIAKEILGSADGVLKANTLVNDMQVLGQNVGTNAATTFRQAGIDAAQALTGAIDEILKKYKLKLKSKKLNAKQLAKLQKDFALDLEFAFTGIPALANGGIVTQPTLALIGEAGPEAVVPLDRAGDMGGGVTINVNGGDPQAVVDAITRWYRQNGATVAWMR